MSEKTPNNNESSPIRSLFRRNEEAYQKHQKEKDQQSADTKEYQYDDYEPEMADDTAAKPKSGLRAAFGKFMEIITQTDDIDLISEDDDEEIEDIFAEDSPKNKPCPPKKPSAVNTSHSSVPEKPQEKKSLEQKKPEHKKTPQKSPEYTSEAVLYSAAKSQKEEPKAADPASAAEKTPKAEPEEFIQTPAEDVGESIIYHSPKISQPPHSTSAAPKKTAVGKTEITLDDILRVKSTALEHTTFQYTSDDFFAEPKPTVQPPVQKASELSHDIPVKPPVQPPVQKTGELSHDIPVKPPVQPPVQKTGELSHDIPVKPPVQPPVQKTGELSHDTPVKPPVQPPVQKTGELSHDIPVKPPVQPPVQQMGELSHDTPVKPSVQPPVQQMGELSHDDTPTKPPVQPTAAKADTYHADDIPGGEGISIEPWKMSGTEKTDFSEGISEPLIYKNNETVKFVVMAGKFTATLRNEYQNVRKFRVTAPTAEPAVVKAPDEAKEVPNKKVQKQHPADAEKKTKAKKKRKTEEQSSSERKRQFGFRLSDIFGGDDFEFDGNPPDDEEIKDVKPQIDDYCSEEDAEAVRDDINDNLRKVFVRTIILCVTCVASIITALLCQLMPDLFGSILRNGWLVYGVISFVLLAISVFAARYPIVNGLMPLRKFKGNSDTAASAASVAGMIQAVTALFLPDIYINGTYHIYVPLVILILLLNSFGKLLIIKRTADNFHFICSPEAQYAGKIYTNSAYSEKFVSSLPSRKPLIAYTKKADFMSNFLRLSYAADPVEELGSFIAPFAVAISVLCGIAYGLITKDFIGGVSSFALTSCITTPMCSLIAINIPMKNLCAGTISDGAMVAGYETVKQFCDTNVVMLDSSQLYPKGSIILSGIKAFNESKLKTAIMAGAAVTFAVDGPMSYIFDTIIQGRKNTLPSVDSVSYDDKLGLCGWIGGQRILIGNRELLEKHNIAPPDVKIEEKYRRMGNEIAYISMAGELVAMFVMTYKADREIARSLRVLEDNGVSFVVRTIDCNITQKHIAEKFSLYPRCVKVLPTGLGSIASEAMTGKEKTSRAYLVTNGKLQAFASAISGCIRIKSTVTISKIIQYLALVIGFILVTIISFVSGFAKLGCMEMLLYTGFWCAALIIVSIAAKKLM